MNELRCIYFEDDPDQSAMFGPWITEYWNDLDTGVPITLEIVASHEEVLRRLSSAREPYQLLIADLLVGDERSELGLQLIRGAHRQDEQLAIVALSIGPADLDPVARQAGASGFVPKSYVIKNPSDNLLGRTMLAALKERHHEPTPMKEEMLVEGRSATTSGKSDAALRHILNLVGRGHVLNLCHAIVRADMEEVKAFFVRPGLSDAIVLRTDCALKVAPGHAPMRRELLLKMSKDAASLAAEVTKDIRAFPDGLFVPFAEPKPVSSGDWYCIAAPFKHRASTLNDWLCEGARSLNSVKDTLSRLFLTGGLLKVCVDSGWQPDV